MFQLHPIGRTVIEVRDVSAGGDALGEVFEVRLDPSTEKIGITNLYVPAESTADFTLDGGAARGLAKAIELLFEHDGVHIEPEDWDFVVHAFDEIPHRAPL